MKKVTLTIIGLMLMASCSACNKSLDSKGSTQNMKLYQDKLDQDLRLIGHPAINYDHISFVSGLGGHCLKDSSGNITLAILNNTQDFSWFTYYAFIHEIGHALKTCTDVDHVVGRASFMNKDQNMIIYEQFRHDQERLMYLRDMLQ